MRYLNPLKYTIIGRGKIQIDESIYNIPQFFINHTNLMEAEIAELKTQYQERSVKFYKLTAQADVLKEQLKQAESKLSARNTQIADLKHRLERAESVTSLLCKYGKDTERNKRLSLPHEIFVAIDKVLEK